jgi:hypothetical protein
MKATVSVLAGRRPQAIDPFDDPTGNGRPKDPERQAVALVQDLDRQHLQLSAGRRELFRAIARADRPEVWQDSGAVDFTHWVAMRYGLSWWKARRWVASAHALDDLPGVSEAFARGELSTDQVIELTRFATPDTERALVTWARSASPARIRERADRECGLSLQDARQTEKDRSLSWAFYDEGRRFGLHADLPAADGAAVARALEREAERIPVMSGEEASYFTSARRADALVALCSARIAQDPDPDRATVVVHARAEALATGSGGCEIEDGPPVHPETARRLLCTSRFQVMTEDARGEAIGLGRMSREPSAAILRQLRYRDRACRFPGCGSRRFTQAHHIVWWSRGGWTDLENLLLTCTFHHKLVHEFGWKVERDRQGEVRWFRPGGVRYRAGPGQTVEDATPAGRG